MIFRDEHTSKNFLELESLPKNLHAKLNPSYITEKKAKFN